MHWFTMLPVLLAATEQWYESVWFKGFAVLAVVAGAYSLGVLLGNALRMPDYGWKIGVILASFGLAPVVIWARWPPNLGVDLNGGMILIYEVDKDATISTSKPNNGDPDDPAGPPSGGRAAGDGVNLGALANQISRRINPSGTVDIKVRPYGDRQIEIIVPETDPEEVGRIKRLIEKAGVLEFLIVADSVRDLDLIELAATESEREQTFIKRNRGRAGETTVGRWVKVGRELTETGGVRPLKVNFVMHRTIRNARTKARISVPPAIANQQDKSGVVFAKWLAERGIDEIEVLMVHDEKLRITGNELSSVQSSFDEEARPCVNFNMTSAGGSLMARLTSANTPDPSTRHERNLGIVLDDELLSAPTIQSVISDHGRITGQFTPKEVNELVGILRGGSLSAVLIKEPVSENPIGPELGADVIRKGAWSSGLGLLAVLVFMVIYYRFAGVVAVATLAVNLGLMLAIMVLFHATFTLSGIAGVVLTMGMAVDANVLIFERIREELARGAALRMALRNGFNRATTTIVDSNVTTLITAIVLYVIGTDQIRGFAVTLTLGIVLSMYAAIFCARVVFDIAERKRWLTRLTMIRLLTDTKVNFMGQWVPATAASVLVIAAGLIGTFLRGPEILGIDFTGGTSLHLMLQEPMPVDQVRARLTKAFEKAKADKGRTLQFNVVNVPVEGQPPESVYKVDSSLNDEKQPDGTTLSGVEELKRYVAAEFINESTGASLLKQNLVAFNAASLKTERISLPGDDPAGGEKPADTPASTGGTEFVPSGEKPKTQPDEGAAPEAKKDEPAAKEPAEETPEDSKAPESEEGAAARIDSRLFVSQPDEPAAEGKDAEKAKPEDDKPADTKAEDEKPADPPTAAEKEEPAPAEATLTKPPVKPASGGDIPGGAETPDESRVFTEGVLTFDLPVGRDVLRDQIRVVAEELGITLLEMNVVLRNADPTKEGEEITGVSKRNAWSVRLPLDKEETAKVLSALEGQYAKQVHWPSWNRIGGSIADRMKRVAVFALLGSCLGIIAYVWFRFEKLMYGLAAIVAVVHDVLIMLAAIALSHWLYGVLGFALIEDFKINLIEVAAFLTIIGYSLNDTIVVFDRIREVKGKRPDLDAEMVNTSINQTLSRTLLTAGTTILVVIILYFLGGQGVHGFAFALLVGVLAGTYSSIFIAAPILLWMSRYAKTAQNRSKAAA